MKKYPFLTAALFLVLACHRPYVNIPDRNFRNALLNSHCMDTDGDGKGDSSIDTNNDNLIQLSEIEQLEFLDVSSQNIKSLEGIQNFVNLKALDCFKNELTTLDVTQNTKLKILFCFDNKIEKLDLSKNSELVELGCRGNRLTSLDLSQNKKLKIAYCYQNRLLHLNVMNGNNSKMTSLWVFDNPELHCIEVDKVEAEFPVCDREDYSGWCKDATALYSTNCDQ